MLKWRLIEVLRETLVWFGVASSQKLPDRDVNSPARREIGSSDAVDLRLGAALVEATLFWPTWVHRRVDSVEVLEGENGRRRHSVDCTPLDDPRLAYDRANRGFAVVSEVNGPLMVPLMYIPKGPLRDFDAYTGSGAVMPVLGTRETTQCGVAMVLWMLHVDGVGYAHGLVEALEEIVGPNIASTESEVVRELLQHGVWKGRQVVDPEIFSKPDSDARNLVETLASAFLLVGLLDADTTGYRQVLKLSYHWHIPATAQSWGSAILIAAGFKTRLLRLRPDAGSATSSYHLEVRTPREADCVLVQLPGADDDGPGVDVSGMPVAHVYMKFDADPTDDAVAIFRTPVWGLRGLAMIVAIFSCLTVLLALVLDDAMGVWRADPEGPATVLLVAPAVFFTFIAVRRESALLHRPLMTLRFAIAFAGISLLLVAASIVGGLVDGWIHLLWWTVAVVNGAVFVFLLTGRLRELSEAPPIVRPGV
ncbi:hypothetical protein B4U78_002910 [Microbacterium esteraromaticum]|nr:hypothetical protein B4U78_002910 [Microbacterium esteraromaticum]